MSSKSDDDFEKTLKQLDERSSTKSSPHSKESKKHKHEEDKYLNNKNISEEKSQNENSPPNKGLASKLSNKVKKYKEDIKVEVKNEITDTVDNVKVEKKAEFNNYKIPKVKSNANDSPSKHEKKKKDNEDHNKSENKKIKTETNKTKENKDSSKTPNKSKNKKDQRSYDIVVEKKTPIKKEENTSEGSSDLNQSINSPADPLEKKKQNAAAYKKFLSRSGPRNPGSKPIPEGSPECLKGMTFVMTGVMESLDREEASGLIKKYGGKVTTSVSKNTSYLLIGDEPGDSKISKAEKLKTKILDEDGLLEMIKNSLNTKDSDKKSSPSKSDSVSKSKSENISHSKKSSPNKLDAASKVKSENDSQKSSPSSKHSSPSSFKSSISTPKSTPGSSGKYPSSSASSPSSTSSSPKTQPLSTQELSNRSSESLMWVDKYKPASLKNIIGQQGDKSNAKKLLNWLKNWNSNHNGTKKLVKPSPWAKDDSGAFFKAALLSGPPGVGKTTTAHLVCKEANFDFVEMNASDTRSKRSLEEEISQLLSNTSLVDFAIGNKSKVDSKNHALVMDEVDGMAGNEDRGGVQELIGLIKKSKVPIICMCNDRNHPKIRSLANYCFDLRFYKPRLEQIRGAMMSVCFKEGIKVKPEALDQIITGSNQDVRQILHHLSVWSANEKNLDTDQMKKDAEKAKKDFKLGPWDVCRKVFTESELKNMNIHDKSSLFFHDYSIAPLFVQENYPKVVPHIANGNRRKTLEQLAKTAHSLADGDLVERQLRSNQAWSLLPTQAVFSSVLPGEYMCGHLAGQIEFPSWLGNNSRKNKFNRISQELQMHMRLKISGSKTDVSSDYSYSIRNKIIKPLIKKGSEGVAESVEVMTSYDLLREDLDSLSELTTWPGQKDLMSQVETKVKSAFTRTFNKESHMSPYASVSVNKSKKSKAQTDDLLGEDDNVIEESEPEDEGVESDAMIKVRI